MPTPAEDAQPAIDDARAEVARRRAAGEYPQELLRRLDAGFTVPERDFGAAPEALAHVPSGRPLHASGPKGAVTVAAKRAVRRMLAWYVHPITADQSRFNAAITAELRRLERRVDRLEASSGPASESDSERR